jgi:hypothetical protein
MIRGLASVPFRTVSLPYLVLASFILRLHLIGGMEKLQGEKRYFFFIRVFGWGIEKSTEINFDIGFKGLQE